MKTIVDWLATDDEALTQTLAAEVRAHVKDITAGGGFYGYAVLSLAGDSYPVQYLSVAYNRESDLKPELGDDFYFRTSPNEWANYGVDALPMSAKLLAVRNAEFAALHSPLRESDSIIFDGYQIAHVNRLHKAILNSMRLVKAEGHFDVPNGFAVVWAPDSPDDVLFCSAKALNSTEVFDEFVAEFGDEDMEYECDFFN